MFEDNANDIDGIMRPTSRKSRVITPRQACGRMKPDNPGRGRNLRRVRTAAYFATNDTFLVAWGIEILTGYPVNHLIEFAAAVDIRPIIVRQERIGLHMADAISRMTSGRKLGVFCMQHGPGTENAYGGVAQAFGDSIPILVVPQGYQRRMAHVAPNYNAVAQMRGITKSAEPVVLPGEVANVMRRAFSRLRNGRGGPVLVTRQM